MSDNAFVDYKVHKLQYYYSKYSEYLVSFQNHIERIHHNSIISLAEKMNYYKIINETIRQMGVIYNDTLIDIRENDTDDTPEDIKPNLINSQYDPLIELGDFYNNNDLFVDNSMCYRPLDEIKETMINKLAVKIGFYNLSHGLSVILGENFQNHFDDEFLNDLLIYDKIFIPIKIAFVDNKHNQTQSMIIKRIEILKEVIVTSSVNIYIKKNKKVSLMFSGYFINDPLNIILRTSQIYHNPIFIKKKEIEEILFKKYDKNDEKFVRTYMRNCNLGDLMVYDTAKFVNMVDKDYKLFNRLSKMRLFNIKKEFIQDNTDKHIVKVMFNIIKLLLFGNSDNIRIAAILFDSIKDKSENQRSIADIIYDNLNNSLQIKLRKSTIHIKNEIEKIKEIVTDDIDLPKNIAINEHMPEHVKKIAYEKTEEMKSSNNEYYKQSLYVRTLLNFPWPSPEDDKMFVEVGKSKKKSKQFLDSVMTFLDNNAHGHKECKETFKELLGKWIKKPTSPGYAIGLAGPPGVGKTLMAKAIGRALDIPFVQITLGGQNDGELLHGHGYTYSGAQPGMIVKKMCEAGSARCIFYFDELDKACKKNDNNEIFNILIHVTDPTTNHEFQDRFFQEINFPLNKVLFIFSYNKKAGIDKTLLSRIDEIEVEPFKLDDKKTIVRKFIIGDMCDLVDFNKDDIEISDDVIVHIIESYTEEAGVRDLKRKFEKIFLKMNIDKIYDLRGFKDNQKFILSKEIVETYLGKKSLDITYVHQNDIVGVINGLYATDNGQGGITPIQIFNNYTSENEKFILRLTGHQRKVMRESVWCGYTAAIHAIKKDLIDKYTKEYPYGFHIHTPSAAVPKNGPSAGCAFAVAFISRILNLKIRQNIAITGEIELTGRVSEIGGLVYKIPGAKRAGVKQVFVPMDNQKDIDKMKKNSPQIFTDGFEVILVDHISQILERALIGFEKSFLF